MHLLPSFTCCRHCCAWSAGVPQGRSPSWRALSSSISVSDSIRGLAKKYSSDVDSLSLLSSPELSPLAATPPPGSAAQSQRGDGSSPAMAPTPHHLLEGLLERNALYESPSGQAGPGQSAGAAAQQAAAGAQPASDNSQPGAAAGAAEQQGRASSSPEPLLHGEITPSGAVHLAAAAPAFRPHAGARGTRA